MAIVWISLFYFMILLKYLIVDCLVLVCALLELFKLIVKHSELPGDALYSSMQTPVLTVLGVEIVLIPLTLLLSADHCVLR